MNLSTASAIGAFANKNVGANKAVTAAGFSISGIDATNYTLIQPLGLTANITAANLNITSTLGTDKVYNANTVDTLNVASSALSGKFVGDTVNLSTASAIGAFADKNVGTNKAVTALGFSISGIDVTYYTLIQLLSFTTPIKAANLNIH